MIRLDDNTTIVSINREDLCLDSIDNAIFTLDRKGYNREDITIYIDNDRLCDIEMEAVARNRLCYFVQTQRQLTYQCVSVNKKYTNTPTYVVGCADRLRGE